MSADRSVAANKHRKGRHGLPSVTALLLQWVSGVIFISLPMELVSDESPEETCGKSFNALLERCRLGW